MQLQARTIFELGTTVLVLRYFDVFYFLPRATMTARRELVIVVIQCHFPIFTGDTIVYALAGLFPDVIHFNFLVFDF